MGRRKSRGKSRSVPAILLSISPTFPQPHFTHTEATNTRKRDKLSEITPGAMKRVQAELSLAPSSTGALSA